jgi:hypothetical protein
MENTTTPGFSHRRIERARGHAWQSKAVRKLAEGLLRCKGFQKQAARTFCAKKIVTREGVTDSDE